MRKLITLIALLLAGSGVAYADGMTPVVGPETVGAGRIVASVYNDSGGDLTSGALVVWDEGDTEFERTGYPYVTTTTDADDDYIAGVIIDPVCRAATMCQIVTHGWVRTNIADATDAATADEAVSTTTVAGQAGACGGGAQACCLGIVPELRNLDSSADTGTDLQPMGVYVNIICED